MSPLARFEKLEPERRARILEVAAREFAARGYEGASLNRILVDADLSKGAFYYYFADKADLFVTVVRSMEEDAAAGLDLDPDHLTAESWWPNLAELVEQTTRAILERPEWVGLGRAFYELEDHWHEGPVGEYLRERLDQFARRVERGQGLGVVRDDLKPEMLVHLWMTVNTLLDRWALDRWDDADETERQMLIDVQFDMLFRMLMPQVPREDS